MSVPTEAYIHDDTRHHVLMRLRRAEGQLRGLQRQIESSAACIDVLTQLLATTRALQGAAMLLMVEHLHDSVAAASDDETLQRTAAELSDAVAGLVRS